MTDKQIRHSAWRRLSQNGGNCVSLVIFLFSVGAFLVLCESTIYLTLRSLGFGSYYDIRQIHRHSGAVCLWVVKTAVELLILSPVLSLVRRLFIDISRDSSVKETRQYIAAHSMRYYLKAIYASFIQFLLKFFAAVPGMVAVYGIYHFWAVLRVGEMTSAGLFSLTICVSFAGAWVGLLGHYYISLSLTPYIMALNPRTNVFDACDLSVKLMDGNHGRYIRFLLHYLKLVPLLILVYPLFMIYPYFKLSYCLLMNELLGRYSQDKMPGMIKRWRKHQQV